MHRPKSQWRTVVVALAGIAALLAGLVVAGHWGGAGAQYPAFAGGVGLIVSAIAAKAYGEHKETAKAVVAAGEPQA